MKKNLLFALTMASLLVLSGCSTFGYGEFTVIEDPEAAETKYNEAKALNEEIDDVEGYESVTEIVGSYTEDEETISIDTTLTSRIGMDDTKYASDTIMENTYGTYTTFVRFDETENKYYDYTALNFSYTDPDTDTEVTIDSNMFSENAELNIDAGIVYDAEMISDSIPDFQMLVTMSYSDSMTIYTSTNGYYKIETDTDQGTEEAIFDENGSLVEMDLTTEDVIVTNMIDYSANLEIVDVDTYEERDMTYSFTFLGSMLMFITLSMGGLSDLI